jgi:radical SAM protein with 4Fe4S-binding SPASM domain
MSYVNQKTIWEKIYTTRSVKSFAQNFLLGKMAGQKIFLYNRSIPRVINISFNEKTCMFSCRMCPYSENLIRDHYRSGSYMSFETLACLVESVPNDYYYSFDISAIGETLAFDPLPDFIAYMKKKKPRVNSIISTNGLLLSEEVFLRLAETGVDSIQISLFAENPEDHRRITGTRSFRRIKENLEAVGRLKKRLNLRKPFLQTFMIECKENMDTSQLFRLHWSQFVDKAFIRPMYNVGRKIEGMTPVFKQTPTTKRYPCIMPWYSTAVRSSGDVLPCYMYHWHEETWEQSLGNIKEQSLEEIWHSKRFETFRRDHLLLHFDEYPVCRKCNLWDAYTNIWKSENNGIFQYDRLKLRDLFTPSPSYRGG